MFSIKTDSHKSNFTQAIKYARTHTCARARAHTHTHTRARARAHVHAHTQSDTLTKRQSEREQMEERGKKLQTCITNAVVA